MDIGKKIKELRLQNDLTLGDLASRSELTKGFLSQVERNLTAPSIATLEDILEALGSNLSDFFHEEEEKKIVFQTQEFFVDEQEDCTIEWIVPKCTEKSDGTDHPDTASQKKEPDHVSLSGTGIWLCIKGECDDRTGQ